MENNYYNNRIWYIPILLFTMLFFAVYGISLTNYLLYHSLSEMFSIVISVAIFIIAWNTRHHIDNRAFLVIGVAHLFIGVIDLFHLLAYKGIGVFGLDDANLPTQLWIASRLLQSLTFFIAPFFIHRNIKTRSLVMSYSVLTALLMSSIFFWKIFPVCFVEGSGLTPFKKISEYVFCLVLAFSVYLFHRNRDAFDQAVYRYIIGSISLSIFAGFSFTLYTNVYDVRNFFGHYFKFISSYLIYKALIEIGLRRPYDVLFRDLKQKEVALGESEAKYRSMMEAIQDPVYISSPDFKVSYMNPAMISLLGYDGTGESCYETVGNAGGKCDFCVFPDIQQGKEIIKETFRQKEGRYYSVTHSPIHHLDGTTSKLAIFRDVSDLKQVELELRHERDKARLYLDIVANIIVVLNTDSTVALINKRGCELLETDEKEIIGRRWFDAFVPEKDRDSAKSVFQALMAGEIQPFEYFENLIISVNQREKHVSWHNSLLKDDTGRIIGTLSSGENITESRKLQEELLWELSVKSALSELVMPLNSSNISIGEIANNILEKAKAITGSQHGFVSAINPENGDNISYTLTEMMPDQCGLVTQEKVICFPKGADGTYPGLWGHALNDLKPFFTNSPKTHSSSRGVPEGHIPIVNFLSVPVMSNDNLIGQIALCNKKDDFDERDLEAMDRLGRFYALAMNQWQILDSLRSAKEELEARVEERTQELSRFNVRLINEIEERKILEQNLLRSEKSLKNLSARLIQSYEEERRRIGEELHDGLAQTLSAIKVWSDAAMAQMEKRRIEQSFESIRSILALAKSSVEDVRRIIKNLRPAILDDLGLYAAISWLCQEFEKIHPAIALQKEIHLRDEQFPENLKIVIFRILQEAFSNISKHSNATVVSMRLDQSPEKITMEISDNGRGFNIDEAKSMQPMEKGIGLTSMEERANLSGGDFAISSSPGQGTRVHVIWKVQGKGETTE